MHTLTMGCRSPCSSMKEQDGATEASSHRHGWSFGSLPLAQRYKLSCPCCCMAHAFMVARALGLFAHAWVAAAAPCSSMRVLLHGVCCDGSSGSFAFPNPPSCMARSLMAAAAPGSCACVLLHGACSDGISGLLPLPARVSLQGARSCGHAQRHDCGDGWGVPVQAVGGKAGA